MSSFYSKIKALSPVSVRLFNVPGGAETAAELIVHIPRGYVVVAEKNQGVKEQIGGLVNDFLPNPPLAGNNDFRRLFTDLLEDLSIPL